ncbi:MAG: hypothetical protein JO061_16020 [Acidobacteriaceae bacterium]|nr:hypothetical protein [Acidobacteriaceae bacterium]
MNLKDKLSTLMFYLFALSFCAALIAVWPVLVSRLNVLNWIVLALAHSAMLMSIWTLYRKAARQEVAQRFEVALTAGLALMVSASDLSILSKIAGH